jgi:hypothetical protein
LLESLDLLDPVVAFAYESVEAEEVDDAPDEEPPDEEPPDEEPLSESLGFGRLSVTYQPLPLNTMPTGWRTRRSSPPQPSWMESGGSEKLCRTSMCSWQPRHAYS